MTRTSEEALWRFLRKRPGNDPEKSEDEKSEDETSDDGGNDDDGTPGQPQKQLRCHYGIPIVEVEAPDPVEHHGEDEGPSFC